VLGTAPVLTQAPVVATPAAHWALDDAGGTTAADSVNAVGNLTVPTGTKVSWVSGEYNTALAFSGTEATTTNVPINTSQSYSATAWVQMSSLSGYQAAVAVNGVSQAAFALDFTPQSNLSFTTYSADSAATAVTRVGSTTVPVLGQWYAVAATYNATTKQMAFYLNGTLQGTASVNTVFQAAGSTQIGAMQAGGVGQYQWWNGGVDEVNLYQRVLTQAEITTMATPSS
jgi:hypothetical protein